MHTQTIANLRAGNPQRLIAYGTSLTGSSAWPAQLQAILAARFPGLATLTNSGKAASHSGWGVEKLRERVTGRRPDMVFIEFSINDAYLPYHITLEACRANLEAMLNGILAANSACEPVLMVMNPCVGEHAQARPRLPEYCEVYRRVAEERGLPLIDHDPTWRRILAEDRRLFDQYVPDGIHPAPIGCEQVITPAIAAALLS